MEAEAKNELHTKGGKEGRAMCWAGGGGPSRVRLKGPQHSDLPGVGWEEQ